MRAAARRVAEKTPWELFIELPDDDRRELIDGEFVETEMPTFLHEHIVLVIGTYFRLWVKEHGGAALPSGYKVRISDRHGFMPDVQLYHPKSRARIERQGLTSGAPDIAVEILSPGSATYDKKAKLLGYAGIGVAEYWIVSPEEHTIERLVLRRGKYLVEEVLMPGESLAPPKFPGLVIPVAELFETPYA